MASVRVINEAGEVACRHRDLSVCDECWSATPGLVKVYERDYRWLAGAGWTPSEVAEISAGTMAEVRLSPETVA